MSHGVANGIDVSADHFGATQSACKNTYKSASGKPRGESLDFTMIKDL